jgi:hypothetical protein
LHAMAYKDLNSATVIECNFHVRNNVKESHLYMFRLFAQNVCVHKVGETQDRYIPSM